MLAVIVLFASGASSQVPVFAQPGTVVASVEFNVNDVADDTSVDVYTVPAVPGPHRFKITDLVISNANPSAAPCARIFTGPGHPPAEFARTACITVPANGSVDHSFINGINFSSGQVVTVRNGTGAGGSLSFTLRGYLFAIP
jgi:hypothetical protein